MTLQAGSSKPKASMRETRSCVRRFAMRLGQSSMALAILARETKRSRLLSLGTPIANRPDPVRVAEGMAWLDVLSGGRLEMGLVKGAPYEIAPANSNPANLMRRYWEAHGRDRTSSQRHRCG